MKTLYEVLNVDLVNEYTKARKLAAAANLKLDSKLLTEVKDAIAAIDIPEDDERMHWVQKLGRTAGVDLLTIGKVQPENMLAMASLPADDFKEAVKVATNSARNWKKN
jgi:hypothetical protein